MAFIVPEVFRDLAQAAFIGKAKVLTSSAVMSDDTLVGQPGATVHFPKWNTLTDLSDLTKGVAITPQTMGQTDNTATIKEAGTAVVIDDQDKLTMLGGAGGAESEALRQFGILAARKVDGDLISAAVAGADAGHTVTPGAGVKLSWSVLVDQFAKFGDEFEPEDFAGIFINSAQMADLFKDSQFIDASKIGDNSVVRRGTLGNIGGIPVNLTNRVSANTVLTLKTNALGALYKRHPLVEQDRDVLKRQDVATVNVHYAVKVLDVTRLGKVTLS